MNIHPTSEPTTPTNVHAEENNDNQAEFTNPFCTPVHEHAESSSRNIGNSNVHYLQSTAHSEYDGQKITVNLSSWKSSSSANRDNLQQILKCVCSRSPLYQFDRLQVWELVDKPFGKNVIRNKARLVAKGYAQEEGIDFEESFSKLLAWRLLGFLSHMLHTRLQIHQSPRGIFINLGPNYFRYSGKKLVWKKTKIGTPMATKPKLDADLSGEPVDQTDYRSKIGSLMYLTSSRPDIVQAVCYCARYQARPTEKHLKEVKRIFRYLRGTIHMGLWYPKGSGFELTAFSDADHAGCIDTRKSTSGGIQFLGDKLVSWMSKKQNCTAMSSAEAEYVALSASCAQVMWMRTQLQDYGFNYNKIPLYCDSQSAIAISCNPVQHSRTKHIHTRYHFIKEQVENGIIELYFVRTEYQLADMFTKALPEERFQYLVRRIGMRHVSTPAELGYDKKNFLIPHIKHQHGRMPTKIELTLEQSQQGVSNDVLVSIEGVEELKRNVWIKGLKKAALHTT
ncbi:hypothetical protein Tco_0646295 [Tanacetum coccineum]